MRLILLGPEDTAERDIPGARVVASRSFQRPGAVLEIVQAAELVATVTREAIDEAAYRFSRGWFAGREDFTQEDGVSLAFVWAYSIQCWLARALVTGMAVLEAGSGVESVETSFPGKGPEWAGIAWAAQLLGLPGPAIPRNNPWQPPSEQGDFRARMLRRFCSALPGRQHGRLLALGFSQVDPVLAAWAQDRDRPFGLALSATQRPRKDILGRLLLAGARVMPGFAAGDTDTATNNLAEWHACRGGPGFRELTKVAGVDFHDLISPTLESWVGELGLQRSWRQAWGKALRDMDIRAVLAANDCDPPSRLAVLAAEREGIPSIEVQHGITGWRVSPDMQCASHLALWGERTLSTLPDVAPEDPRGRIVGAPAFDRYRKHELRWRGRLRVLVVSTNAPTGSALGDHDHPDRLLAGIVAAFSPISGLVDLTVKIHPAQDLSGARRVLAPLESARLHQRGSLLRLLAASDLVVADVTTAALEAALLGRAMIVCYFGRKAGHLPALSSSTGVTVVESPGDLTALVERAQADASGAVLRSLAGYDLGDFLQTPDGLAARRVYEWVKEIIGARVMASAGV